MTRSVRAKARAVLSLSCKRCLHNGGAVKAAVVIGSALALGAIVAACATGDEAVTGEDVDASTGGTDAADERKQDAGTIAQPDVGTTDDATADAIDAAEAEAEAEAGPSCI